MIKLITLNDLHNYGNRLQNYATQRFFRNHNYIIENIVDESYYTLVVKGIKKRIKSNLIYIYRRGINHWLMQKKMEKNFLSFNKMIIYSGIETKTISDLKEYESNIFVVGSDQVWNPQFGMSEITLLKDLHCEKKVSFSSSFGVDDIPYNETIAQCINDFDAISVRETAGARIIKELTGRDSTVLVDPTMLLTNEEWRAVSKKPKRVKDGYILTYFLSPMCEHAKENLDKISAGRKVYELLNPEDKVVGAAGPSEFLWLFDHADIILTDSFHACVFSFLFNKPFIVYDRNWGAGNMNSRIETLLSKFHLERKYANSGLDNDIWEHDYTEGYKQLEIEREKAIKFLKEALGVD